MWCKNCNRTTYDDKCELCGEAAQPDTPTEVYWCDECKVPIIKEVCDEEINKCPICGQQTKYLSKDLRPVFPEERLLMELLLDKPLAWLGKSVWCDSNRYYIDGRIKTVSKSTFEKTDTDKVRELLKKHKVDNSYVNFEKTIKLFIKANATNLCSIKSEASSFIKKEAINYPIEQLVVSFSGGKDSTVISDLVVKELAEPKIVHIYGDTTLEFPLSYEYKDRFKKQNPLTILKVAKNKEQNFYDVCDDIGPYPDLFLAQLMLFPVEYSEERPLLSKALFDNKTKLELIKNKRLPNNFYIDFALGLLSKSSDWEYEKEWRILLLDDKRNSLKLPPPRKIFLGVNIEENAKKRII